MVAALAAELVHATGKPGPFGRAPVRPVAGNWTMSSPAPGWTSTAGTWIGSLVLYGLAASDPVKSSFGTDSRSAATSGRQAFILPMNDCDRQTSTDADGMPGANGIGVFGPAMHVAVMNCMKRAAKGWPRSHSFVG
jgi:hypothetical protein